MPDVGDPGREGEHFVGEPGGVADGADRGKGDRQLAPAAGTGLVAQPGACGAEQVAEPSGGARPRLETRQGAGVAFEEGDVRAEAGDRQLEGVDASARELGEGAVHERGLAVAPGRNQEDLLALGQVGDEPRQLVLAIDEGLDRDDFAVDERILHPAEPVLRQVA